MSSADLALAPSRDGAAPHRQGGSAGPWRCGRGAGAGKPSARGARRVDPGRRTPGASAAGRAGGPIRRGAAHRAAPDGDEAGHPAPEQPRSRRGWTPDQRRAAVRRPVRRLRRSRPASERRTALFACAGSFPHAAVSGEEDRPLVIKHGGLAPPPPRRPGSGTRRPCPQRVRQPMAHVTPAPRRTAGARAGAGRDRPGR